MAEVWIIYHESMNQVLRSCCFFKAKGLSAISSFYQQMDLFLPSRPVEIAQDLPAWHGVADCLTCYFLFLAIIYAVTIAVSRMAAASEEK